jgi:hypothetical protein
MNRNLGDLYEETRKNMTLDAWPQNDKMHVELSREDKWIDQIIGFLHRYIRSL